MTHLISIIRRAWKRWTSLPCDECNRLGRKCDYCERGIGLL